MKSIRVPGVMMAALAFGLGTSGSAAAEGFYFALSGGASSFDTPVSAAEMDGVFVDAFAAAGGTVLAMESGLDDSDRGWGLAVGYRWGRFIAAEVGYMNFGEALYEAEMAVDFGDGTVGVAEGSLRTRIQGPALSVLGIVPIGETFDLHGRGGVLFADTRVRLKLDDVSDEFDGSTKDLFAGIGGTWNFAENYSARIEYQRFFDVGDEDNTGEQDVDFITLSILFR